MPPEAISGMTPVPNLQSGPSPCPLVVILILNWNGGDETVQCLASAQKLSYQNYLMVVLDNGSTDDSIRNIVEWFHQNAETKAGNPVLVEYTGEEARKGGILKSEDRLLKCPPSQRLVLIRNGDNFGFAEGNNIGFSYAISRPGTADFVFLLNNDARIEQDCLERAVDVAFSRRAAIVGALVKTIDGKKTVFSVDRRPSHFFYLKPFGLARPFGGDEPSTMVLGCGMLISRALLVHHQAIWGFYFDPRLFLYGEETLFCLRALTYGHRIFVAKKAIVYHGQTGISSSPKRKSWTIYYMTRNAIFIANDILKGIWLVFFHMYYPLARFRVMVQLLFRGKTLEAEGLLKGLWDGYLRRGGRWRMQK